MEELICKSFYARIYLAGPILIAEQIVRKQMFEGGCITIAPTKYIYRGGEELGYVVEYINYPRFPKDEDVIKTEAKQLANRLLDETFQRSYTIVFPDESYYYSKRVW